MKMFILTFVMLCCSLCLAAQTNTLNLENTKWHGSANIPDPTNVVFSFTKDTVSLLIEGVDDPVEVMTYTMNADTMSLKKVSGKSPCGDEVGTYKIKTQDKKLTFTLVKDDCVERSSAFDGAYTLTDPVKD